MSDLEIRPTEPSEADAVCEFLCSVFQVGRDASFVSPALVRWKYFDPSPGWCGTRSHVLRYKGSIIAHGCVCPISFMVDGREITSMHVSDWAASPSHPGAGLFLLRELFSLTNTWIGIGGSEATLAMVDRSAIFAQLELFAQVMRPWREFRQRATSGRRRVSRLVGNTRRKLRSRPVAAAEAAAATGWGAGQVDSFEDSDLVTSGLRGSSTLCKRDAARLNHFLGCPSFPCSGYLLTKRGRVRGYFLLIRVGPQVRIAHLSLDSLHPEEWKSAYAIAVKIAGQDGVAHEVVTATSWAPARSVLLESGFRSAGRQAVVLGDPNGYLKGRPAPDLSMLEGDTAYLYDASHPYAI